jgi:uroporphyrinogen-III synthase
MILYLGLCLKTGYWKGLPAIHYPVIRTEKRVNAYLKQALLQWPLFSHVIFTSQTAVGYWFEDFQKPLNQRFIAVGKQTAKALHSFGVDAVVAEEETQEGVIALLEKEDLSSAFVFWPKSTKARPLLLDYLKEKKVKLSVLDLYETVLQKLEPVPDLSQIEEIVFTSPSTIEGFLQIYGSLPSHIRLTAIGPVTEKALSRIDCLR